VMPAASVPTFAKAQRWATRGHNTPESGTDRQPKTARAAPQIGTARNPSASDQQLRKKLESLNSSAPELTL
jgi:hypothetical protein